MDKFCGQGHVAVQKLATRVRAAQHQVTQIDHQEALPKYDPQMHVKAMWL